MTTEKFKKKTHTVINHQSPCSHSPLIKNQRKNLVRETLSHLSVYEYTAIELQARDPMHACKPSQYLYVYKTPCLKRETPPSMPFSASEKKN
jgi:hypothetical protein